MAAPTVKSNRETAGIGRGTERSAEASVGRTGSAFDELRAGRYESTTNDQVLAGKLRNGTLSEQYASALEVAARAAAGDPAAIFLANQTLDNPEQKETAKRLLVGCLASQARNSEPLLNLALKGLEDNRLLVQIGTALYLDTYNLTKQCWPKIEPRLAALKPEAKAILINSERLAPQLQNVPHINN